MKNKGNKILVILGILCILMIGAVAIVTLSGDKKKTDSHKKKENTEDTQGQYITYNGKKYEKNPDVKAVLFLGVDKESDAMLAKTPGESGQSDSMNLLVMNTEEKTAQFLQISRDTMTQIDVYDISGNQLTTEEGQIALQYAYGDGKEKSCRLTSEKVSELLYGIDIDNYFSLTVEGIAVAADALGGIELTVPEDYTYIDPAFRKGATITLKGEQAETYVRKRDMSNLEGNNDRMERQSQFMKVLMDELRAIDRDTQYMSLYNQISSYLVTNMTADEMKSLAEYKVSDEFVKLPGTFTEGDGHAQFHPDEEKLKDLVMKWFYKPI